MIVGAIEGFSIWKGKGLLKLKPVNRLEVRPFLSDEKCNRLISALEGRKSSANVFFAALIAMTACIIDWINKIVVFVLNTLILMSRVLLCVLWQVADFTIKYSIIFSIPALSYLYLKQVPSCCNGENFLKPEWALGFIYVKVSCYAFVFIVSFVAYIAAKVRPRTNSSIGEA